MGSDLTQSNVAGLVTRSRLGERQPLARLLTYVERGGLNAVETLKAVNAYTGNAYVVGITGPPGAGKSTLADQLTTIFRSLQQSVGILAVDPTSPFSGGAFLGDRVRMQHHFLDPQVFIRSMATRGNTGGLTRMANSAIRVMEAAGLDIIIVETVGVGQTELDVMKAVDTVIVVMVPEAGDGIQALKAGLIEAADIFVVNKADREGAKKMVGNLESMLSMAEFQPWWRPPIVETEAHHGKGINSLYEMIQSHREALTESSRLEEMRHHRFRQEFLRALEDGLTDLLHVIATGEGELASRIASVQLGKKDPLVAAYELLGDGEEFRRWLSELEKRSSKQSLPE